VVLYLHRLNRRAAWSMPLTVIAVMAALVGFAIDIGFATGAVTYGEGLVGGPLFYAGEVGFLVWLLAVNVLGWRSRSLPIGIAVLGIATAATATLPVWAVGLARVDQTNGDQRQASSASSPPNSLR
jgi:hypothetical protein